MYVATLPSIVTEPFAPSVSKLKVKLSPSISVPDKLTTILWSSLVVPDKPTVATGASSVSYTHLTLPTIYSV